MPPVICMVTARQLSSPDADRSLVDRVRMAARSGVHLVQLRQPDYETWALTRLVEQAVDAVRGTRARVLVNDRLDIALAGGAHGVHLRGDSSPASRVRAFAPAGFIVGRSVHSAEEARQVAREGGLDYLIFGTVFSTPSKPDQPGTGIAPLAEACVAIPLPVLAIGGMSEDRLGVVASSGAAGFAAINLFADRDPASLVSIVDRAARAFDMSKDVSLNMSTQAPSRCSFSDLSRLTWNLVPWLRCSICSARAASTATCGCWLLRADWAFAGSSRLASASSS